MKSVHNIQHLPVNIGGSKQIQHISTYFFFLTDITFIWCHSGKRDVDLLFPSLAPLFWKDFSKDRTVNHTVSPLIFTDVNFFFLYLLRIFISLNIFSFPEVEFFHKEAIQEMMLDLLFCFCKTHPELSYKQVLWLLLLPVMRWFLEWLLVFAPFTINELRGGGGSQKYKQLDYFAWKRTLEGFFNHILHFTAPSPSLDPPPTLGVHLVS